MTRHRVIDDAMTRHRFAGLKKRGIVAMSNHDKISPLLYVPWRQWFGCRFKEGPASTQTTRHPRKLLWQPRNRKSFLDHFESALVNVLPSLVKSGIELGISI